MAAWLNFFLALKSVGYMNLIAGFVALIIAIINIKDFFLFGKGVSLRISDKAKPKIFEKMRDLIKLDSTPLLLISTVVLAVSVNLYELLCTLGFPMVYTKVLSNLNIPKWKYYLFLGIYNLVYILPLLAIVFLTAVTLGRRKLQEREGRALKLLSGYLMLSLGVALIFFPEAFQSVISSLGLILIAVGLTGITLVATRGSEKTK